MVKNINLRRRKNLIGKRYNRLLVIAEGVGDRKNFAYWVCKCDCGNEKTIMAQSLLMGMTLSCGCLQKEGLLKRITKHGETSSSGKSTEYQAWLNMKARCYNPSVKNYINWGGRGIVVCERWLNEENGFVNFLKDMGRRPSPNHSVDRFPNNESGHYEPGNCRWATGVEQHGNTRRNVRIEYNGETKILKEWADYFKVPERRLSEQLKTKTFAESIYYLTQIREPGVKAGAKHYNARKIGKYQNGELVKKYDCVQDVKQDGINVNSIYSAVCFRNGKYKGFEWKYLDEKAA